MTDFPEQLAHDALTPVFPDVWIVKGLIVMGGRLRASRNMTVVREDGALTLINTVRLNEEGLAALDTLGEVQNIVKLGSHHGRDDAFYVSRYGRAAFWSPPGMPHERGLETGRVLGPGAVPISDSSLFVYETSDNVEAVLHLSREGGILIPCDSLQNWEEPDAYFDEHSKSAMAKFIGRATIGFGWLQHAHPKAEDFARLSKLEFAHLLPSHGTPLLNEAGTALRETFAKTFPGEL